jgi:hypothetical protein
MNWIKTILNVIKVKTLWSLCTSLYIFIWGFAVGWYILAPLCKILNRSSISEIKIWIIMVSFTIGASVISYMIKELAEYLIKTKLRRKRFKNTISKLPDGKIYFTKFLPVEGEITKGDWYMYKTTMKEAFKALDVDYSGPVFQKTYQKVKLFMCSRDIQIGDEVYNIVSNSKFTVTGEDTLTTPQHYYMGYQVLSPAKNTFKKVGEISPEAKWVTEGMEFNKEQLQYRNRTEGLEHLTRDVDYCDYYCYVEVMCDKCGYSH